ncbi:unnamed protein product [Rhizoctonia solani]|uniref:SPX domain-containing protein n=1 Tax=Rhizoctonia solani TaxID=456999 RepID=A0A8H3E9Z9_9AGAM|nr:unnamed protein product [Rhizoctonia solani]
MKFSRYLEETRIPEWKRAYLNYQLLKEKLSAVKRYYGPNPPASGRGSTGSILRNGHVNASPTRTAPKDALHTEEYAPLATTDPTPTPSRPGSPAGGRVTHSSAAASQDTLHDPELTPNMRNLKSLSEDEEPDSFAGEQEANGTGLESRKALPVGMAAGHVGSPLMASRSLGVQEAVTLTHHDVPRIDTVQASSTRSMKTPKSPRVSLGGMRRFTVTRQRRDTQRSTQPPASLEEILSSLNPIELRFFETFYQEVEKVDAFYKEREKDAILKVTALREQIEQLRGHKKLLDEYRDGLWPGVLSVFGSARHSKAVGSAENSDESRPPSRARAHVDRAAHDPDAYRRAKKKLKKAVLEFYRSLEYLQNYRGFVKVSLVTPRGASQVNLELVSALKKFDKIAKVSAIDLFAFEPS